MAAVYGRMASYWWPFLLAPLLNDTRWIIVAVWVAADNVENLSYGLVVHGLTVARARIGYWCGVFCLGISLPDSGPRSHRSSGPCALVPDRG